MRHAGKANVLQTLLLSDTVQRVSCLIQSQTSTTLFGRLDRPGLLVLELLLGLAESEVVRLCQERAGSQLKMPFFCFTNGAQGRTLMSPDRRAVKRSSEVGWKTRSNTCESNLMSVEDMARAERRGRAKGEA